jgi:hypothetical protein
MFSLRTATDGAATGCDAGVAEDAAFGAAACAAMLAASTNMTAATM